MCWKTTPIGWDAVGQSWSTGLNSRDEEVEDPWYALASGIAHRRWERAHAGQGQRDPLPPGMELSWGVEVGEVGGRMAQGTGLRK